MCEHIRMSKLKYFVDEHPEVVRIASILGVMPIHLLAERNYHSQNLEAAVDLLHAYPDSFGWK